MSFQPTKQQDQAIKARGGSILVSAAAGSGKTAVLVQRVLRYLTDPQHSCRADELLIVTFTRAAAAQMREKIHNAIGAQLKAEPENTALLKQQQLLPLAQICTIDSFCLRLLQEHGAAYGLPQNLRLLDDSERRLLRAESLDETLESAYQTGNPAFEALGLLLEVSGDDTNLRRRIQFAANKALAHPNPEHWLGTLFEDYTNPQVINKSKWAKRLLAHTYEILEYCHELAQYNLETHACKAFEDDLALATSLQKLITWDDLRLALHNISYTRLPKGVPNDCKARRDVFKKLLKKTVELFCTSEQEYEEDLQALQPISGIFVALVRDFIARYNEKKAARQAAEFNDILHWSLMLLVNQNGAKTPLAKQLSEQFREILVDEYQDINAAQGLLFDALSRNGENLFLVGDVKQSIYGFRQASPQLFLKKRATFAPYNQQSYPACIILGKNFRSKRGVTDAVNFTFRQLMTTQAAQINYTQDEELVCGRDDISACDTQLHLLECDASAQAEASYIADFIVREMQQKNLQPRDFCILLRADKKDGMVYAQALQRAGVAAYATEPESLFESREIQLLLSLLRVVDNPVQDIALAALLLSPMVGFSAEDLARLSTQHCVASSLYHKVCAAANTGDLQCEAFIAQLAAWRCLTSVCAVGELVHTLLDETGLLALTSAMPQPARRRANLHRLADYARDYSARNTAGLGDFLRYLSRIETEESSLLSANTLSESANVVRIMSIHKSKGLEFPVCILAQCTKRFNLMDLKEPLLLHDSAGLGFMRPEMEQRARLQTISHTALKTAIQRDTLAEELRLLYVAMTRAKDQLILLASSKNLEKMLQMAAASHTFDKPKLPPALVQSASCYADWLLPVLLRHPCAKGLRDRAQLDHTVALPANEQVRFVFAQTQAHNSTDKQSNTQQNIPDDRLLQLVYERLDYHYPYETLNRIAAKRAVSELTEQAQQALFAFSSRPSFARTQGITAAQRGNAMHTFLQFADFRRANNNLCDEIARLQALGYLTTQDAQALEREKLETFFASSFAARMLASPRFLREQKFTLRIPVTEFAGSELALAPEALQGEDVIVQGIIDCAFEEDGALILLDYKTDRVETMVALLERYGEQLRLYRRAMRECFGIEVTQALIYSFWLGEWIEV